MKSRALNDIRLARLQRLAKRLPEKFPAALREAIVGCVRIVTDREEFPELGSGKGQKRFLFGSRDRERHLLRLEAICLSLQVLLHHCELVDLRCGRRRRDGSCDPIRTYRARAIAGRRPPTISELRAPSIEQESGLGRNALGRALRDLRDAGYVSTVQPTTEYVDEESGDKKHRGWPGIHSVTLTCFKRLGVDLEWLQEQRAAASERRRQGPEPAENVTARRELRSVVRTQLRAARRAALPKMDDTAQNARRRELAEQLADWQRRQPR